MKQLIKPYEFWHPRLFESPYYVYLAWRCLLRRLPPKQLAKANWALDHGEIGIGSKFATQQAFRQARFPDGILLTNSQDEAQHSMALTFAADRGYPLILKPDIGSVGKGVVKVHNDKELERMMSLLHGPYILQTFCAYDTEFGVFFVRSRGVSRISGINGKHFPTVRGDGRSSLGELASRHYRYTPHWQLFLKDLDTRRIPKPGEEVRLSFIGSHTMGCKFTDDTHMLTPELERAVFDICDTQPGFNFGRLDVKAKSVAHFTRGEFVVIEVNGIASLPTHMFDPDKSVFEAYRIFLQHGRRLVDIAAEHRHRTMPLRSWREILDLVRRNRSMLDATHRSLVNR